MNTENKCIIKNRRNFIHYITKTYLQDKSQNQDTFKSPVLSGMFQNFFAATSISEALLSTTKSLAFVDIERQLIVMQRVTSSLSVSGDISLDKHGLEPDLTGVWRQLQDKNSNSCKILTIIVSSACKKRMQTNTN